MAHDAALQHHTSTGLDNRKLAIWIFIGSEVLFFATLISTYVVYKGQSLALGLPGPFPHEDWTNPATGAVVEHVFEIPLVTFGTAVLLFSSFFVVLALNGLQHGKQRQFIGWLAATVVGGLFFIGMQVYEFTHFVHKGLGFTTNLFGSSFFTLTGFHGTHVTLGVLWLGTLLYLGLRGKMGPEKALNLELAALYWHFVDVVWIVIFPVVYLMK